MICEICGKPKCTEQDLEDWKNRPYCYQRGDCDCPICNKICWENHNSVKWIRGNDESVKEALQEKTDQENANEVEVEIFILDPDKSNPPCTEIKLEELKDIFPLDPDEYLKRKGLTK